MATTEELAVKLEAVDQRSKSNTHQIEDIKKRQDNLDQLVASVSALATEQEHIKKDVTEIKADVKTLAEKPAKRWDGIVDKLIWAVLAAGLGFVLAQIGIA